MGELARILRREVKYRLPLARLPALRDDLRALLAPDPHGAAYQVRTLYFDTPGLLALQEKVAGVDPRFKLRVRAYPPVRADARLVAEVKAREGPAVWKQRTTLSPQELDLLVAGRHGALLEGRPGDPVLRRFVAAKARLGACVPLVVEYRREALQDRDPDTYLRVTLDTELRAVPEARLVDPVPSGVLVARAGAILEVKTEGAPPPWLAWLARKHALEPAAVSKYELCCRATLARLPAGEGSTR